MILPTPVNNVYSQTNKQRQPIFKMGWKDKSLSEACPSMLKWPGTLFDFGVLAAGNIEGQTSLND